MIWDPLVWTDGSVHFQNCSVGRVCSMLLCFCVCRMFFVLAALEEGRGRTGKRERERKREARERKREDREKKREGRTRGGDREGGQREAGSYTELYTNID